jgi:hypothetical protein
MRAKPNTDQFRPPGKDPSDFLESGAADLADQVGREKKAEEKEQEIAPKIVREQKIFRLPVDMIRALKTAAYERSMTSNSRVTETDLVETAIKRFLKL